MWLLRFWDSFHEGDLQGFTVTFQSQARFQETFSNKSLTPRLELQGGDYQPFSIRFPKIWRKVSVCACVCVCVWVCVCVKGCEGCISSTCCKQECFLGYSFQVSFFYGGKVIHLKKEVHLKIRF
ncbi:hypothetical protein ANANG_G00190790 [Anguilla anguilla]|uniref:Uncharacterized protein n=1 Tax=Anguilla anguilla TaxID=7936 RepID=A0A9D3M125_ANGAN|nr:hypothetical protein ANANG_G00190790 [Anguilla anguilla]